MPFERLPRAIVKPLLLVEQARRIPLQFLTAVLDLDAGSCEVSPPSPRRLRGLWTTDYEAPPARSRSWFWKVKRGLDACAALGVLVLLSPILLIVALVVAATIGPPLFSGNGGRDAGGDLFTFISSGLWAPRTGLMAGDCQTHIGFKNR